MTSRGSARKTDGMPHAASAQPQAGHPELDRDHAALAELLERVAGICCDTASRRGDCGACADDRLDQCHEALTGIATDLMIIMLAHFHHEVALMAALPATPAVKTHCVRHRRAHVDFSTRYNATIAGLDRHNAVANARLLEGFICDWVRSHALEYDTALADFLNGSLVR
jgi:hemerythrin